MAYDITFALDLFNKDLDPNESLEALNVLANALFQIDVQYLLRHPNTPYLYQSGIRYELEPDGEERWQDIPTTLKRGQGDCEDLAAWRAAEMFVRMNIPAKPRVIVTRRLPDGRRLYHVIVDLPNGQIEDPSVILGMRKSFIQNLVSLP